MDLSEFKTYLALEVESTALWRSEKAEQYSHDKRNQTAVEELDKLAANLGALPDDHPDLKRLWWEWYRPRPGMTDIDLLPLIEAESGFIKRIGFDHMYEGDVSRFLKALAKAVSLAA